MSVKLASLEPEHLPSLLPVGINLGIPPEVYYRRELGVLSSTALSYVDASPATYHAWIQGELEDEDTEALAFGRAFHVACLETARFASMYAVQPDFGDCRTKGPKANRDAWRAEHAGRTWLSPLDGERLRGMAGALHRHPRAEKILRDVLTEVTLRWDHELGLPAKARLDAWARPLGLVVDLKSTQDASWTAFSRDVERYGYHRQHAFYVDGLKAVGFPDQDFVFISIEKAPPYLVGLYTLHAEDVRAGREANRLAAERLAQCLHRGTWPGLPEAIQEVRRPRWARAR